MHYGDTTLTFLSNLQAADDRGQGLTYISGVAVEVLPRIEHAEMLADDLRRLVALDGLGAGIPALDMAARIEQEDRIVLHEGRHELEELRLGIARGRKFGRVHGL